MPLFICCCSTRLPPVNQTSVFLLLFCASPPHDPPAPPPPPLSRSGRQYRFPASISILLLLPDLLVFLNPPLPPSTCRYVVLSLRYHHLSLPFFPPMVLPCCHPPPDQVVLWPHPLHSKSPCLPGELPDFKTLLFVCSCVECLAGEKLNLGPLTRSRGEMLSCGRSSS